MTDETSEKMVTLLQNWPRAGQVLKSKFGESVPVKKEYRSGGKVVYWTTAVVDDEATGWYLRNSPFGLKCMIDQKFHEILEQSNLEITSLTVIRRAASARALIGGLTLT